MHASRALAVSAIAAAALGFAAPAATARDEPGTAVAAPGQRTFLPPDAVLGAGAAVRRGADGTSSGATPTDMAIGGSLVAAAIIAGGVLWWRGRSDDES
ncbi:hypothetical protein ACWDA7_31630 [Streptomyces sp. NPDC001156]